MELKAKNTFWIAQITGWSLFGIAAYIITEINPALVYGLDQHYKYNLPDQIARVLVGIIFGYLNRIILLKYNLIKKSTIGIIIFLFVDTSIISFAYFLICTFFIEGTFFHVFNSRSFSTLYFTHGLWYWAIFVVWSITYFNYLRYCSPQQRVNQHVLWNNEWNTPVIKHDRMVSLVGIYATCLLIR